MRAKQQIHNAFLQTCKHANEKRSMGSSYICMFVHFNHWSDMNQFGVVVPQDLIILCFNFIPKHLCSPGCKYNRFHHFRVTGSIFTIFLFWNLSTHFLICCLFYSLLSHLLKIISRQCTFTRKNAWCTPTTWLTAIYLFIHIYAGTHTHENERQRGKIQRNDAGKDRMWEPAVPAVLRDKC